MITEKHISENMLTNPQGEQPCCAPAVIDLPVMQAVRSEVKLLSALADPTRLQIVTMLARRDEPLCVCDVVDKFDLGQPTVSHHLKVLREAGLVHSEKRGLWVYYSLNRAVMEEATSYLNGLLQGAKAASGLLSR